MIGKDRRSRILLEELGCGTLEHHTHVEVQIAHLLRNVRSGVNRDDKVDAVLSTDGVDQILVPRNPIFPSIPAVDDLVEEDALNKVAIPLLGSLQLLKDVLLGELSGVWNASVSLVIRLNCCSILSLDVEQDLLGSGTES